MCSLGAQGREVNIYSVDTCLGLRSRWSLAVQRLIDMASTSQEHELGTFDDIYDASDNEQPKTSPLINPAKHQSYRYRASRLRVNPALSWMMAQM